MSHVDHGSPTCGLPSCIMWPMATFVNYVQYILYIQKFKD